MITRYAIVSGAHEDTVRTYLPGNYFVVGSYHGKVIIAGEDRAGWTLENYVIPRLFSGAYGCQEMFTQGQVDAKIEAEVEYYRDLAFPDE